MASTDDALTPGDRSGIGDASTLVPDSTVTRRDIGATSDARTAMDDGGDPEAPSDQREGGDTAIRADARAAGRSKTPCKTRHRSHGMQTSAFVD